MIDTARYPVQREGAELDTLVAECDRVASHAHQSFNRTNVYVQTWHRRRAPSMSVASSLAKLRRTTP